MHLIIKLMKIFSKGTSHRFYVNSQNNSVYSANMTQLVVVASQVTPENNYSLIETWNYPLISFMLAYHCFLIQQTIMHYLTLNRMLLLRHHRMNIDNNHLCQILCYHEPKSRNTYDKTTIDTNNAQEQI